jgi:hypothetical protein
MPDIVTCPGCGAPLRVGAEHAGKNVRCPQCDSVVTVPAAARQNASEATPPATPPPLPVEGLALPVDEEPVEVRPTAKPRLRQCLDCGEPNAPGAHKCRRCGAWLDEEEDWRRRRRPPPSFVPCPKCGARDAMRVSWTIWGSFYGPALFSHVRCPDCGHKYNGRTGRPNLIPAILFITVPAILIALILGGLGWAVVHSMSQR